MKIDNKQLIKQVMKISSILTLFVLSVTQLLQAEPATAQLLHRGVTIRFEGDNAWSAVQKLEKTTIRFAYHANELKLDHIAVADASFTGSTVQTVLQHVFGSTDVAFTETGGFIVLNKKQQPGRVVGQVTDTEGAPLAGATIRITGIDGVYTSDSMGNFSIALPPNRYTIRVNYIAYHPQEHTVSVRPGSETPLTFSLPRSQDALDEIVVVGYGTQSKANLTGAVSTVDFTDLDNVPQANTVNILSGRLSGVSVVQPGGQPGADQGEVAIRGLGTLNDPSPLVIIDGVQATLTDLGNLSPQDIANVSVLKDASSAAIYGARGGNGVILVTTREPKSEKININVLAYTGIQKATYLPQMVESWQYMTLMNEAVEVVRYTPELIDSAKNGIFSDNIANTKWFDHLFKAAPMQQYSLSVNGKTKGTTFQLSGGVLDQEGILRNTNSNRYTLRGSIKTPINKFIKAGLNVWGYNRQIDEAFTQPSALIRQSLLVPIMPIRYANGEYATYNMNVKAAGGQLVDNPILNSEIGFSKQDIMKVNAQPSLEIKLMKGLNLRSTFTYSYEQSQQRRFNPTFSYNSNFGLPVYQNKVSQLINASTTVKQLQWQSTLTYNRKIGDGHHLQGLLGHEIIDYRQSTFQAQGENLPSNKLPVLSNASANFAVNGTDQQWALQSFFGRINYSYANRYLAEFSLRTDGSSRLDGEYRLSPSGSVGWLISEEPFFASAREAISFLKIRGGYGKLGNDRIGNYTFQQSLNLSGYYGVGGALQTAASITEYGNPLITWEQTATTDIGLDIGILKNKLTANFDLYRRLTDGILFRLPLPLSFGDPGAPMQNIAEVTNSGFEITVEHHNQIGPWNYNLSANFSYNKNRIEHLNHQRVIVEGGAAGMTLLQEGSPINSWFGYVADGLYTQADLDAGHPTFHPAIGVGSLKFLDINGDGVINDLDRTIIGDGTTPYTFGLSGGLSYKGIDFSFLVQGTADKDIYIYDRGNRPGNGGQINFWHEWWTRSYHPERNPDGDWPIIKSQSPDAAASSSFYLSNASYVRLKNIELGYSLPASILDNVKIKKARVYVSGQNVFTYSSVPKNLDPERSNFQKNNLSYPQTRIFTVGCNVTF